MTSKLLVSDTKASPARKDNSCCLFSAPQRCRQVFLASPSRHRRSLAAAAAVQVLRRRQHVAAEVEGRSGNSEEQRERSRVRDPPRSPSRLRLLRVHQGKSQHLSNKNVSESPGIKFSIGFHLFFLPLSVRKERKKTKIGTLLGSNSSRGSIRSDQQAIQPLSLLFSFRIIIFCAIVLAALVINELQ